MAVHMPVCASAPQCLTRWCRMSWCRTGWCGTSRTSGISKSKQKAELPTLEIIHVAVLTCVSVIGTVVKIYHGICGITINCHTNSLCYYCLHTLLKFASGGDTLVSHLLHALKRLSRPQQFFWSGESVDHSWTTTHFPDSQTWDRWAY